MKLPMIAAAAILSAATAQALANPSQAPAPSARSAAPEIALEKINANYPTSAEIIAAATKPGAQPIKPEYDALKSDHRNWTLIAASVSTNDGEKDSPVKILGQFVAKQATFLPSLTHDDQTIVYETQPQGTSILVSGQMEFKRVGLFAKSWEIAITWDKGLPPGIPLSDFKRPLINGTPEAEALRKQVAAISDEKVQTALQEQRERLEKADQPRLAAMQRQANLEASATQALNQLVAKTAGKWIPYTILKTPGPEQRNSGSPGTNSSFQAAQFEVTDDPSRPNLIILKEPRADGPRETVQTSISNGLMTFRDGECEAIVTPGFDQAGALYISFGTYKCPDKEQRTITIIPEERALDVIANFGKSKQTPVQAAISRTDANEAKLPVIPVNPTR